LEGLKNSLSDTRTANAEAINSGLKNNRPALLGAGGGPTAQRIQKIRAFLPRLETQPRLQIDGCWLLRRNAWFVLSH
jgi:hypothetical protein